MRSNKSISVHQANKRLCRFHYAIGTADALIRDSLEQLAKSVGLEAETFSSAQAFLESELPDKPSCLVLDIRMPGMSGLDLQDKLAKKDYQYPSFSLPDMVQCP